MNSEVLQVIQNLAWPIGLSIIGYFLVRLIKTLDRVDKSVNRLDITVTKQEAEQTMFRLAYQKDQETNVKRLDAHAEILEVHSQDIATLKERSKYDKG